VASTIVPRVGRRGLVAELHEVTTLKIDTIDRQLQTLEQRRANAAKNQDRTFLAGRLPFVAGKTETSLDPAVGALS